MEKRTQNVQLSSSNSVISLQQGKIPPQAIDLEEAVLGAMLIDKKGVDTVIDILQTDVFYKTAHQYIFESIYHLFETSEPIDLLTVSSALRKNNKLELVVITKSCFFCSYRIPCPYYSAEIYSKKFDQNIK